MHQQVVFTNKDISRMEIRCPNCKEILSIPITEPVHYPTHKNAWQIIKEEKKCLWCEVTLNSQLIEWVLKLQELFRICPPTDEIGAIRFIVEQ